MVQLALPIFPVDTIMINEHLGIGRKNGVVTYFHCGLPIYLHSENDHRSFRFITSKLLLAGVCRKIDICRAFHVTIDSVKRYVKRLETCGDGAFFMDERRNGGTRYKLLPDVIARMQRYVEQGKNNCEIARLEKVTEGTVRHALKQGVLKKSQLR